MTVLNNKWIVPFKGRNISGLNKQNFLWNEKNIYIMDNHRAALWCWFQHIHKNEKINLIHIDKHSDCKQVSDAWIKACPDLMSIDIEEYLAFECENHTLFNWGNYITFFLKKYNNIIGKCIFATHNKGDKPDFEVVHANVWDIPGSLSCWIEQSKNKTILNLDLDYLFYECDPGNFSSLFSDKYLEELFLSIKKLLDTNKILCFTMSISPECCGGWEMAENMCYKFVKYLKLDFKL